MSTKDTLVDWLWTGVIVLGLGGLALLTVALTCSQIVLPILGAKWLWENT